MRNLIAIPVIFLSVILQSAVISRVYLLSGIADLPLVMLSAWALQEDVESSWHWAAALGLMVGFVSAIPWYVPVLSYLIVVGLAQSLQRRVWQAPLLAMFSVTFFAAVDEPPTVSVALTVLKDCFASAVSDASDPELSSFPMIDAV